jgi:predicted HicB family RNase H-like nuclease
MPETVVHFQIRMPPVLHERLASWAMDKKISHNAAVVAKLKEALERREAKGSEP